MSVAVKVGDPVVKALKHQLSLQKAAALYGYFFAEAAQRAEQQQHRLRAGAHHDMVGARVDAACAESVFLQRRAQRFLALRVAVGGQQIVAVDHVLDAFFPFREVDHALVDALAAEIKFRVVHLLPLFVRLRGGLRQAVKRGGDKIARLRSADDIALHAQLVIGAEHRCFGDPSVAAELTDRGETAALFETAVFDRLTDGQIYLLIERHPALPVRTDKII